jgi:HD-like signal output (HDOD) protein
LDDTTLSNAFVAGLVHDIGKIMFVHFLPDEYRQCMAETRGSNKSPSEIEMDIIGASHGELGGLLAERWQLPHVLPNAIRGHHTLHTNPEPSGLELALFWGNQVSKKLSTFEPQMAANDETPAVLTTWIGTPLDHIVEKIPEIRKEAERAEMMIQIV